MAIDIKICGLTDPEAVDAALSAGADLLGFVSFPASPRHCDIETMAALTAAARGHARLVVLTVDPSDRLVGELVGAIRPDWIQLHGSESPQRVTDIKRLAGLPVIKALGVRTTGDLDRIAEYRESADRLLFDAKPPAGATRPGGLGRTFDWRLLQGLDRGLAFMLSGGLNADNVAEAIRIVDPPAVDVSSGVETAPGRKHPQRIRDFVRAARLAAAERANNSEPGTKFPSYGT